MDTDEATERAFRSSRYPAPNTSGGVQGVPVARRQGRVPMWAAQGFNPRNLHRHIDKVRSNSEMLERQWPHLSTTRKAPDLDVVDAVLGGPEDPTRSIADFNATSLSKFVNCVWGFDSIFVRYSELLSSASHHFAIAAQIAQEICGLNALYAGAPGESLFWRVCDGCARRIGLRSAEEYVTCSDCGTRNRFRLARIEEHFAMNEASPRVDLDDVLIPLVLAPLVAVHYMGSAAHLIRNAEVGRLLKSDAPNLVWRPRPVRGTLQEMVAVKQLAEARSRSRGEAALRVSLSGRASLLYALLSDEQSQVTRRWRSYFNSSTLDQPTGLSEPDRIPQILWREIYGLAGIAT